MSRRLVGTVSLLVASIILGVLVGEWFFRLFLHTLPPLALSSFSQGAAHGAFITYGCGVGAVLFGWGFLAAFLSRFFRGGAAPKAAGDRAGALRG